MKGRLLSLLLSICIALPIPTAGVVVEDVSVEHLVNPLGIASTSPRISWRIVTTTRNVTQLAYQLRLSSLNSSVWSSGKILDDRNSAVPWPGLPLIAGEIYDLQLRVWTSDGSVSDYCEPQRFSVGLQSWADWSAAARFIGMASGNTSAAPWLRGEFSLSAEDLAAIAVGNASVLLHVASVGYHEAFINKARLEPGSVLLPSVSYLPKRVLSHTYDASVAPLVVGTNVIGLWASAGWAQWPSYSSAYSHAPLVAAELRVLPPASLNVTQPTPLLTVATDATWAVHLSSRSHYGGWEPHDFGGDVLNCSADIPGWATAEVDASSWERATEYSLSATISVSPEAAEPTQVVEVIPAVNITGCNATAPAPGCIRVTLRDMFTGWVNVSAAAFALLPAGSVVTIQHSTNAGVVVEYNAIDTVIVGPVGAPDGFINKFAYHESQYLTVTGLAVMPSLSDFNGLKLTTARTPVGRFSSSNGMLTTMFETTVRTVEGLTTGGMTVDCPPRERCGYGGDGHASMDFAMASYDRPAAFYGHWAQSWADVQDPNSGSLPNTAPTGDAGGGPAWGGFVVTMPWALYTWTGDAQPLAAMFPHMQAFLSFLLSNVRNGTLQPYGTSAMSFLGDWYPPPPAKSCLAGQPCNSLFNNAYLVLLLRTASQVANVLGNASAAEQYSSLAGSIGAATHAAFYNASAAQYLDGKQTEQVMPLMAGMVPSALITGIQSALETSIVVGADGHLGTGLHGTWGLYRYLTDPAIGRDDLLFTVSNQTSMPSYGWFLDQGYTTWPEEWAGAGSRMHGCFNSVGLWFQQGLLGVRPDPAAPGMRSIIVKPAYCVGDVTWAEGATATPAGPLTNAWNCTAAPPGQGSKCYRHRITVPGNAFVTLWIPGAGIANVTESGQPAVDAPGVGFLRHEKGLTVWRVGSGTYAFSSCM